jgi:AcrR family transcriptional regulator
MEKAERRAQILSRAREVFAKHGYHAATVDDIVLAAGVARGTFYLYFEDKRAVFADLVDRFLARIHLTIQRIAVDDPGRTVAQQVRDNIYRVIGLFLNDRAMAKILLTDALGLDADFDRKLGSIYDEIFTLLSDSLREGQQLGIVADGDTRVMAWLSVGAIKELLLQAAVGGGGELNAERLTDHIFSFLNGGYLRIPPPTDPREDP